jgi:type IV pilus assembly protein PilY1
MLGTIRKALSPSLLIAIFFASPLWTTTSYAQGSCETPLFLQQNNVAANVLFIFDSSGSMNDAVYHNAYDPHVTHSGPFNGTTRYNASAAGWYTPHDFDWAWTDTVSAYLVTSDHGKAGAYLGNYLNWVYFHATPEQRAAIPAVTRIQVAKAAVENIILNTGSMRFGVMRFYNDTGGLLISPMGTDPATIVSQIDAIVGDGWTPLAETLVDALYYIRDTADAVEYDCQRTFVVIVTDGFPTQDLNIPYWIGDYDGDGDDPGNCTSIGSLEPNSSNCSDYLDDVALYLFENDLRDDLDGVQNAVTYTIGFNIDSGFLADAAANGGGLYFTASNSQELQSSLSRVFNDIQARISSGSAVAVVSAENAEGDMLFRTKFMPSRWSGHLEAFSLPYAEGDAPVWDAGVVLFNEASSARNIFTAVDGSVTPFDGTYATSLAPYMGVGIDTDADGIDDDYDYSLAGDIIEYVRGEDIPGYRDRGGWKLGDMISSAPVVVGRPRGFRNDPTYMSYRSAYEDREQVVYIGGNDGMLHCFRGSDGVELWAFVPQSCLGGLKYLLDPNYCHHFFVDATPQVFDAYLDGSWRTVLLCGMGEGGDAYFAFDITDPNAPVLLWEQSLPYGETWSTPELARVENYTNPLVFFGSGPDDTNGEAYLVALDLATGQVEWSDLLSTSATGMNMATAPVPIDMDFDGTADLVYVSDLEGHLWRFDLTSASWSKSLLFETDQPIQASPIVTVNEFGEAMLYFGTGRYIDAADISDATQQTFYCVIDNHSETTVGRFDLTDQTYSIQTVTPDRRGWYIDLVQAPGERITKQDALVGGVVYFTSFQPNSEVCGSGGRSWLYAVDFRDGSAKDNDDGSENDTTDGRVEDLGSGIGSEPVFDFANEQIMVQLNDTRISVTDVQMEIRRLIVRSWRERWN